MAPRHELNLLYPLFEEKERQSITLFDFIIRENSFEEKITLEAWPCLRLELNFIKGKLFHYVGSDGIFIVSPGELLHPGYDGFERDQAEI